MSQTLPTRPGSAVREIDRAALNARLTQRESFKLVMASSDWGFRAKHIPGSVHFKNIAELLAAVAKDDDIVVYCSNADCHASLALIQKLREHGYRRWPTTRGASSTGRRAACPSRATGRPDRPPPESFPSRQSAQSMTLPHVTSPMASALPLGEKATEEGEQVGTILAYWVRAGYV